LTDFKREASNEAHLTFHRWGGTIKYGFNQLPQKEVVSPNIFQNSFSFIRKNYFTRKVASGAVLGEAEAMLIIACRGHLKSLILYCTID
jgi:hypothetical protein